MVYAEDLEKIEKDRATKTVEVTVSKSDDKISEDLKKQLQTKIVTNVFKDQEFKEQFLLVFKTMSDILANTLGPYGSSTMIDQIKDFSVTKDGFHVLSNLRFADERHNRIRSILFAISHQMVTKVGDGSTSAVVAAYSFLESMLTFLKDHKWARPKELNERIQTIVAEVCEYIAKNATMVNTDNYLDVVYNISNIATNENKTYTDMITEIYKNIGLTANINIAKSETFEDEIVYEDGSYSNNAYLIDPIYFNRGNECEKRDCEILMFDHTLDKDNYDLISVAFNKFCAKERKTLVVMAPFYDQYLLDVIRKEAEGFKNMYADAPEIPFRVIYLKSNTTGDLNKNMYRDLSSLLGCTIYRPQDTKEFTEKIREYAKEVQKIRTEKEEKGEEVKKEDIPPIPDELIENIKGHIGHCEECIMTNKTSSFKGFDRKNEAMYNTLLNDAKIQLADAERRVMETDSIDNKVFDARTRYTKITCQSATIKVGGNSRLEIELNYDAVDDAVKACASAVKFGYNQGCNLAILKALDDYEIDYRKEKEMDTITAEILDGLRDAFIKVYRTVLTNGMDEDKADQIIDESLRDFTCYDLVAHKMDVDRKVVNSCRTDIEILKGAIAMTGIMLICNQYISSTLNH